MIYEIDGGTKKQRKVIDLSMDFVDPLLNIPDNVFVEIVLMKCALSGCIDMEEEDGVHNFLVEINNKQSLEEIAATIFHELKHVEQTISKRLDQCKWDGVDHSNTPYMDRPWEIEAYGFEEETCRQWTNR
jgi:hypothetical protein